MIVLLLGYMVNVNVKLIVVCVISVLKMEYESFSSSSFLLPSNQYNLRK